MTSPSSEDILRRYVEPAIKEAEDALREAMSKFQGDLRLALAFRSMGLLRTSLDKIIQRVADQDAVEREAVYRVVTERCAVFLNRPGDLVYPVVLRLCGESEEKLLDGVAAPDPGVLASLRQVLLRVTVTYTVKVGERAERTVIVFLHDADERKVHEHNFTAELPWEDLPEDVRERVIRDGQRSVMFTLYPGDGQ